MKVCPECGSDKVVSTQEEEWCVNSFDRYLVTVKPYDLYSKARCVSSYNVCEWRGEYKELKDVD